MWVACVGLEISKVELIPMVRFMVFVNFSKSNKANAVSILVK